MEKIFIYGLPRGSKDDYWEEELLACFPDSDTYRTNINKVKAAASADGFHNFRVISYNVEDPIFNKVLDL